MSPSLPKTNGLTGGSLAPVEQVLDDLDANAVPKPGRGKARQPRWRWRKRLKITILQPGGDQRRLDVVTRNLSSRGLSFLNNGFLHMGTRCDLQLVAQDNSGIDLQAVVVACRYISGHLHEISLRFDEPVDVEQIVSKQLSARILIVDDAEDLLQLTGFFLRKSGAEVFTATSGTQAMALVAQHQFDLILLDVEMPGIDGTTVARTLRGGGLAIPIIAFTANDDPNIREACLAAGYSHVLGKGLGRTELINAIARYLTIEHPITSKHAANPEMAEFINDFVAGLPARIREMQDCVQQRNAQGLGVMARQLKAAASDGGGCGFGQISLAAHAVARLLTGDIEWTPVEQAFAKLSELSDRIEGIVKMPRPSLPPGSGPRPLENGLKHDSSRSG